MLEILYLKQIAAAKNKVVLDNMSPGWFQHAATS
jgi:hypothetical protein